MSLYMAIYLYYEKIDNEFNYFIITYFRGIKILWMRG
jgi:hypothetical protein